MTTTSPQLNKPLRSEREAALDGLIRRATEVAQRHQYGPVGDAAHYSAVSTRLWRRVEALHAAKRGQALTLAQRSALQDWSDDMAKASKESPLMSVKHSNTKTINLLATILQPVAAAAE